MIDWKSEAGRKTAAVSSSLRVLMLVFPISPLDEKVLPFAASSACGIYYNEGKIKSQWLQSTSELNQGDLITKHIVSPYSVV